MKNLDCFSKKRIYKWWLFRIYVKVYRKVSMKKMRSSSARQLIMRNPCTVNRGFVYLEIMELWLVDFQPRFIPRGYMFISQNWNSMCRNMGFVPTNHGDRQEHIWACLYAVFGAGTKKKSTRKPNGSSLSGFSVENCHTWDTDTPFHHEFTAVFFLRSLGLIVQADPQTSFNELNQAEPMIGSSIQGNPPDVLLKLCKNHRFLLRFPTHFFP